MKWPWIKHRSLLDVFHKSFNTRQSLTYIHYLTYIRMYICVSVKKSICLSHSGSLGLLLIRCHDQLCSSFIFRWSRGRNLPICSIWQIIHFLRLLLLLLLLYLAIWAMLFTSHISSSVHLFMRNLNLKLDKKKNYVRFLCARFSCISIVSKCIPFFE